MIRSELEELLEGLPGEVALAEKQYNEAKINTGKIFAEIKIKLRSEYPDKTESEIKDLATVAKDYNEAQMVEAAFKETWKAKEETLRVKKIELGKSI